MKPFRLLSELLGSFVVLLWVQRELVAPPWNVLVPYSVLAGSDGTHFDPNWSILVKGPSWTHRGKIRVL